MNIQTPDILLNRIKPYFEQKEEIVMAFLFGSFASGNYCLESDIDVAVYIKNADNDLEIRVQNQLERILGREVGLVILTRASAVLAWDILRKGIPIVIKDRKIYLDFMLEVSAEAQDFVEFNLDTWRRKYGVGTGR